MPYTSMNDDTEEDDGKDEVFLERGPVQGVIGILGRLRSKHNVRVPSSSMLQTARLLFGVSSILVEQDCARHMARRDGINDSETHFER